MDITVTYNSIIEKLNKAGYEIIAADLNTLIAAGATGSEILFSTGKYLLDLKKNNPLAYETIDEFVVEYLKYCKQNGIIIKS
jgi:hypothetical protein